MIIAETVKVAEAKTHLSQLLAKVEAGDEFVIARGERPIADMLAFRDGPGLKPVSADEIAAWKHEGHRS